MLDKLDDIHSNCCCIRCSVSLACCRKVSIIDVWFLMRSKRCWSSLCIDLMVNSIFLAYSSSSVPNAARVRVPTNGRSDDTDLLGRSFWRRWFISMSTSESCIISSSWILMSELCCLTKWKDRFMNGAFVQDQLSRLFQFGEFIEEWCKIVEHHYCPWIRWKFHVSHFSKEHSGIVTSL